MGNTTSSRRVSSKVHAPSTRFDEEADDPYTYTSGHWLRADRKQRSLRHIKFDFEALCTQAVNSCPGASRIIKYEKKEGGFNRVFVLFMDNGEKVIAKVPFPIAGPRRLTTSSEVATMEYLKAKTSIPIPRVLTWSDNPSSPVGCEYIIMENVTGISLHERWPTMNSHQRMLCVKALSMLVRTMANLTFPAYGSIYFTGSSYIPEESKVAFDQSFCIGPFCNQTFWDPLSGETDVSLDASPERGPFHSLEQYSIALTNIGRSRLPKEEPQSYMLPFWGSIRDHEALLADSKTVLQQLIQLPQIQEAGTPTLMHYDLNKRNIFVSDADPTIISGVIDWQLTSVEPGFVYANEIPDFTTTSTDPSELLTAESNEGNRNATNKQDSKNDLEDARICRSTFEVILKGLAPKIGLGRSLDETLLRPFRDAATSWRNSVTAGRQELVELSEKWSSELGLPGSCSYQPSSQQLQRHKERYEEFETAQKLKNWLVTVLQTNSDGWVPKEVWNAAREANKAAFNEWMQSAKDSQEMDEQKARAFWPFDEMGD